MFLFPVFATATLPLVARFALIIAGLQDVVAAAIARQPNKAALIVLAHTRLQRLIARFASLVARAHAGTLRASGRPRLSAARSATPERLPRGFAWLCRLGSWQAAAYRSQFQHLLADPEMERLLAAAPQAGRILRPLCRMLGILPGPDLPAVLFRRPAPPPRIPPLPILETSAAPEPAWPTPPAPSPRRRAPPRPSPLRAVPA